MKQTSSLPNEGIDDNNVVYHAKTEGYPTMMSYMNELYAIVSKRVKMIDEIWISKRFMHTQIDETKKAVIQSHDKSIMEVKAWHT
jgi:hypothetical protein